MFLESMTVSNWRALKHVHLSLQPGLNLIYGPNESGKSSLQEALRAALMMKSKGRGAPTAARPWSGGPATQVLVSFHHQHQLWQLERGFFGGSSLVKQADRVVARDDQVLQWLEEHLGDCGLASLLSTQGELNLAEIPAALRPQLAAAETVTPGVSWLETTLSEAYEVFYTPKHQKPKAGLKIVDQERFEAEQNLRNLERGMEAQRREADQLQSLKVDVAELRQREAVAQAQVEAQRPLLSAWETYKRKQAERGQQQQRYQMLSSWLRRWDENWTRAQQLGPQTEGWLEEKHQLEALTEQAPGRTEIELRQARLKYAEARHQHLLQQEIERIAAPSAETLRQLEQLSGQLEAKRAALEAGAWEAELTALEPLQARLDGRSLQLGAGQSEHWKTAAGFELELGGARLRVRAGGQVAADAARLEEQLRGQLEAAGLASLQQARERSQQAQELLRRKKASSNLSWRPAAEHADLDSLTREQLEAEIDRLPAHIAEAEREWKQADEQYRLHGNRLKELLRDNPERQVQDCLGQLGRLVSEMSEVSLPAPGDGLPAASLVQPVRDLLGQLEVQLHNEVVSAPEGPEVSGESLRALEEKVKWIQRDIELNQGRLNQILGGLKEQKGLYERWTQAKELLAKRTLESEQKHLQAGVARLLWQSFEEARKELEQDVVAPLRERLGERIRRLTHQRYDQLCLKPDFRADKVQTSQGQEASISELSYGTREQLAFLSRLCLAEMLSEKERNLVVFDDNLVHTDADRHRLACQLLQEAAQSCQILLLTCHPERYDSDLSSAHRIDLQACQ